MTPAERAARTPGWWRSISPTRAEQGFPPKIEDAAILEAAAALVAATLIEMVREGRADWVREGAEHARPA
jgi:hypothetical protein